MLQNILRNNFSQTGDEEKNCQTVPIIFNNQKFICSQRELDKMVVDDIALFVR